MFRKTVPSTFIPNMNSNPLACPYLYSPRHLVNEADTIFILFAQTQNTTRAHRDTRRSNGFNGSQTLIIRTGANDLARVSLYFLGSNGQRNSPLGKTRAKCRGCGYKHSIRPASIAVPAQEKACQEWCKLHISISLQRYQQDPTPYTQDSPSIPIPRTSVTIFKIFSNPLFLPARSLHAAPMQKRVDPFALASRAALRTGSMSTRRDALVSVL